MTCSLSRVLALTAFSAVAFAHYTWVAPIEAVLEPGKSATIRISHGHHFPKSEEAINARQVELFVLAPSGAKTMLTPAPVPGAVTATYAVKEAGLHRIVMLQDRGISSRTPKGVRPGGRDINPDASQSSRTLRSAIAYSDRPTGAARPVGLEFELTASLVSTGWELLLLKNGRPLPNVEIESFVAGADKAVSAGKTNAEGKLTFSTAAKGPLLFTVEHKDAAPASARYDSVNYSTSLYLK